MNSLTMPSSKDEVWHYTSAKKFFSKERTWVLEKKHSIIHHPPLDLIKEEFLNLVFINGRLSTDLSSLSEIHQAYSSQIEIHFFGDGYSKNTSVLAPSKADYFDQLHDPQKRFGLILKVKRGSKINKPIQLVSFVTDDLVDAPTLMQIILEDDAELNLVETYSGNGSSYLQNSLTEIKLNSKSTLHHVRLQKDHSTSAHYGKLKIEVLNSAKYLSNIITVGSQISKLDMMVKLNDRQAEAKFLGLAFGKEDQHHDFYSEIYHAVGECQTQQLYKAILNDKSRSAFTGKIVIEKNAQNANSEQLNKNLLLSDFAESDSRPQLEIYADDVKATHGSTVGQLNPEEIFYLQSRGISKEMAKEILCRGFADEILFNVENGDVRNYLKEIVYATT
jgi:Fe-S cluster assembly protein SufD